MSHQVSLTATMATGLWFSFFLCSLMVVCCNGHAPKNISDEMRLQELSRNTTEILNSLLDGYDKSLRPSFGGPPLKVDVNIFVRSMGPISERDMVYSMDCYFRQNWKDQRLGGFGGPLDPLTINNLMLEKIWKPDTFFYNGKDSYLHTITTPNKFLRISKDGTIYYSMRLTVKASCPMHLENFPMDSQSCPLKLGSYGYTTRDVVYNWKWGDADSVTRDSDMQMSQFVLVGSPAHSEIEINERGNFSFLIVNFKLHRHMGYFLINVYVPCMMLVIISWVGFWINREATSDRIMLGITTVLTMAFLSIDNRTDLPKVSYSTALDWFMAMCFSFVLATIMEFAGVHFFTKYGSGDSETHEANRSESETELARLNNDEENRSGSDGEHDEWTDVLHIPKMNGETKIDIEDDDKKPTPKKNGVSHLTKIVLEAKNRRRDNCCTRLLYCLKGSGRYKNMKLPKGVSSVIGMNSASKIDFVARIIFPASFTVLNIFYWYSYTRHYHF